MARRGGSVQRAFSGGEQGPLLGARADLARWQSALELCENFVTLVQGGATRRSGTADVYAAQDNSRFIPFAFSGSDGYAIEFAPDPGKCRFFRDFGILLKDDLSGPYELSNPFSADEIAVLDAAQTADRMFLASGSRKIQQMQRVANTNWTIGDAPIKNGPFLDMNTDQTISLSCGGSGEIPAGTTGIAIAATAAIFSPLHVGALFRIRVKDDSKHGKWKNGVGQTVGDIVNWDGNWYKCTATFGSDGDGEDPPVHLFGEAWDGPIVGDSVSAAKWLYLHSGFGIVQITGYTDSTHVTATAISYIPDDLRTGTWRWEEGAWSDYRGYPAHVCLHKKRLWAARTASQPTRAWASVIDDYPNFDDSNSDDDKAFSFDLEADSNQVNFPQWMVSGKRLAIGTSHSEFVVGSADVTSPVTANSADPESDTTEGSAPGVAAIKVNNPVFVSADGKRVMELGYDLQQDSYITTDLTIEADHITGAGNVGVIRLAWLRDPYRLLVGLRSDGVLITAVYRKDQQVIGWHRHPMQGSVLDICAAPSPSGIRQDLWLKVRHVLPSGTVTRIECLKPFFERGDLTPQSAWFVDGGAQYSGLAAKVIKKIPAHLIGQTVKIRADGKEVPDQVVVSDGAGGGQVTLDAAASLVTVGLAFTGKLRTLRYDQRLQGKNARVNAVNVDLIRSAPVYVGGTGRAAELMGGQADNVTGAPETLQTGVLRVTVESGWSDDGNIELTIANTGPCTVRAIIPELLVAA